MSIFNSHNYMLLLAFLATFLLWGISVWNGTVKQLILSSWYGVFEDGTVLRTNYTGLKILDFPVSLLVGFFFFGSNGYDQGYQHFLIDAYSTLQSAFVWLYVESGRHSAKPSSIANPIIWGLLWQAFGAAIALPLYFSCHLCWLDTQPTELSQIPLPVARSIPISFVVGAVFPAVMGLLPTWIGRSPLSHQTILFWWQADPVWVSVTQVLAVALFGLLGPNSNQASERQSSIWVRFSYLVAATVSAAGHLFVIVQLIYSNDPVISFVRMYIPKTFTNFAQDMKLVDGPWLFLQYDLIIIALSSVSWAYILVSRLLPVRNSGRALLILEFFAAYLMIGPGATVSLALFWREGEMQRRRSLTIKRGSKGR